MIPITDFNFDLNSSANPQTVLVESSLGSLLKKDYYEPISLEGEVYRLNSNEITFYSALCYKETDKTIHSNYSEWINELTLALDVTKFIQKYKLQAALQETITRVNNFFTNYSVQFELSIDEEELYETLHIFIITPLNTKQASKQIRHMFKGWSLLRKDKFYNYISITTRKIDAI
ncbi:MAG: hypothetical protein ACPG19_03840 [Saprospiraceae bacterium]